MVEGIAGFHIQESASLFLEGERHSFSVVVKHIIIYAPFPVVFQFFQPDVECGGRRVIFTEYMKLVTALSSQVISGRL